VKILDYSHQPWSLRGTSPPPLLEDGPVDPRQLLQYSHQLLPDQHGSACGDTCPAAYVMNCGVVILEEGKGHPHLCCMNTASSMASCSNLTVRSVGIGPFVASQVAIKLEYEDHHTSWVQVTNAITFNTIVWLVHIKFQCLNGRCKDSRRTA
jgi:hypothetical protein